MFHNWILLKVAIHHPLPCYPEPGLH